MDNDLVSVSEQRFSRSMSKPVSGTGDEDTSLLVGVRRRRRRSLFLPRIQRGLRDGRCGCHKGPRDYPKPTPYSCYNKSSPVHGRAVLFEGILVWFVELITHKGSRAEGHPGRSCRYRENSEPYSHAAPERRANHNHRVLRYQSGASRSSGIKTFHRHSYGGPPVVRYCQWSETGICLGFRISRRSCFSSDTNYIFLRG